MSYFSFKFVCCHLIHEWLKKLGKNLEKAEKVILSVAASLLMQLRMKGTISTGL